VLSLRVLTAVFLVPSVVAGVLWLPTGVLQLLTAGVCLVALWEWARLVPAPPALPLPALLALAAALMAGLWYLGLAAAGPYVAGIALAWWLLACVWLRNNGFGGSGTLVMRLLKSVAGLFVVIPAWTVFGALHAGTTGPPWVLLVLAVVWAADISAYFAGRRFGRERLAPSISPGKTRVGAWGGLAGGLLVALVGTLVLGLDLERTLALFALIAVTVGASIIGDLFESMVKRQSGAKDSSMLLPGHGGLFDRLDSLFAALPVFYWGARWLAG